MESVTHGKGFLGVFVSTCISGSWSLKPECKTDISKSRSKQSESDSGSHEPILVDSDIAHTFVSVA